MAREILFYTSIYSYSVEDYLLKLEEAKGSDVVLRMNCPGGDVLAMYGMIAKWNEHKKRKNVKVDGQACSGGFYFCCTADEVECLNVSRFLAHRAAMPSWIERDPELFTEDYRQYLTKVNKDLREIVESKVSPETFERVTGVSLDDMFSLDSRIDVEITAEQAKEMGIVKTIVPLTAKRKQEVEALAHSYGIAAFATEPAITAETPAPTTTTNNTNNKAMTAEQLKAAHPEAYAAIRNEGIKAERDRVAAWMAFATVDNERVVKAVAGTAEVNMTVIAEMSAKAVAGAQLQAVKDDNAPAITTTAPTPEATAQEKNTADFLANCKKDLGLA